MASSACLLKRLGKCAVAALSVTKSGVRVVVRERSRGTSPCTGDDDGDEGDASAGKAARHGEVRVTTGLGLR